VGQPAPRPPQPVWGSQAARTGGALRPGPRRLARPRFDLRGFDILAVDDDWDAREVIRMMLEHHGARVVTASSVVDAVRSLETLQPSVVLADLRMPGFDGFNLIERIRADRRLARLPVVAVTALGEHSDFLRTMAHGFDAHVTKPIEEDVLVSVVRRVAQPRGKG
jgi:CheY-like chemotaxis protein